MLNTTPFYHKSIRKALVAFGSLFTNIQIQRSNDDGSEVQTLKIPIAQAPKEKWLVRVDSDPTLERRTNTVLPRLSFEMVNISLDPARKANRANKIVCIKEDGTSLSYAPVPYNIMIQLYVLTKTQEDAYQIVEQILPYFNPEIIVTIKESKELNTTTDLPIILQSVNFSDEYDGDFQTHRTVVWTLTFNIKANLYGQITTNNNIIKHVIVNITDDNITNLETINEDV